MTADCGIGAHEILVADDEPAIRDGLCALLESEGSLVSAAADGPEALRLWRERRPSLILLDVMMPRLNGYAVCAEVRREDPSVPILFLTAKDGEADELRGLSTGADDYISKTAPESVKLARIAAALRRVKSAPPPVAFDFGACRVDASRMIISLPDGSSHEISPREVEMLRCFLAHPGEVLSRDFLLTRFWGVDFDGGDAALTVAIHRLREKLGLDARLVETVSRQGYRLVASGLQ